ncbi:hypothetical protein Tco_0892704 [Tanacetum coccineum]|uniref:Uncharacterized protein n=1 Tax=Tanacetum coccineum TaxID=301880 RepID=A0ABQ5C9L9_9ASTR
MPQDQWNLGVKLKQPKRKGATRSRRESLGVMFNCRTKRKVVSKRDWFTKPKKPQEPTDPDWNVGKTPQQGQTQSWLMTLASSADKMPKNFDELMSTPIDFFAYIMNGTKITNLTQEPSPVKVAYDKHALWGISHWRDQRKNFYGYARGLESSHDMYSTKRILAVTRVKKGRNRLMRSDELYKFSDGTLTRLRTLLDDITKNIRMEYLPQRRWSTLEKNRSLTSSQLSN